MTNPELDALTATQVMGWHSHRSDTATCDWWLNERGTCVMPCDSWHPTTDARDTERVMERLRDRDLKVTITVLAETTDVVIAGKPHHWASDLDWKRAVCLAAVEATNA